MIEVLPDVVTRVSPVPISSLKKLKMDRTIDFINNIEDKELQFEQLTNKLNEILFNLVNQVKSNEERRVILNLRRDIFNKRNISSKYINIDDQSIVMKINKWIKLKRDISELKMEAQKIFDKEILEKRNELQKMANFYPLRRITALSSQSLHKKWEKYLNIPVSEQNKKVRKTERSISLYLTRMIAKTSPFSSLTLVGYGNISNEVSDWKLENLSWESSIHLNNMVSIYIWELLTSSSLSLYVPLESNPSLRIVDNDSKKMEHVKVNRNRKNSVFLTQTEERVQIPYNDEIYSLYKYIKVNNETSISTLIKELSNNSEDEVIKYIKKLIELKIIDFKVPFNEQDTDYLAKIKELLKTIKLNNSDLSQFKFKELLRIINELRDIISDAKNNKLEYTINSLQNNIEKIAYVLHNPSHKVEKIRPIIYEDCFINQKLKIPKKAIDGFSDNIKLLEPLYVLFDPQIPFKIFIRQNINELLKQGTEEVNIITIQRIIQDKVSKSGEGINSYVIKELTNNSTYKEWQRLRKIFFDQLFMYIKEDRDEVLINKDFLINLSNEIPVDLKNMQSSSWSYFLQPFNDEDFVINKISDGNGKFMGRFLRGLFEQTGIDISKNTKDYINQTRLSDSIVAELNGVFGFNANVHPPISDYEVEYPGVKSDRENLIKLEDLFIRKNSTEDKIELYSKSHNKSVKLLYLQFLNINLVPPLFRFLLYFTELCSPDISINESYFNSHKRQNILQFPRIKIGNIIIKRRQWWVDKSSFLDQINVDNQFERFVSLRCWLSANSIPKQFYLKPNLTLQLENMDSNTHYQDGMRKPQYIDMDSFHMCQIFFNQINMLEEGFIIEEALPNDSQVKLDVNGQKHVIEILLETYNPEWGANNGLA